MRLRPIDAFLTIFFLAAVVRLAGIEKFPPGLWSDEGLNGVDAWHTLYPSGPGQGLRLVYPDVFPREPLLVWILSLALWLGGPRVIVMRLAVALIGSLTCAVFFLAARRAHQAGDDAGQNKSARAHSLALPLAAAFVLATLHWHAHFSRLVFRTNLVPLMACAAVWAVWRASRVSAPRRAGAWILAGMAGGLGFYTYLAWYFFVPVLAVWLWAAGAFRRPAQARDAAPPRFGAMAPAVYYLFGAAIVALPLIVYYLMFPEHLTGRPAEVSPLRDGLGKALWLVARNLRDVVFMFFVRGDHVPKHNVPWTPALGPAWAALFAFGVVRAARHALGRRDDSRLAAAWLAWLVCMSMPSVLSQTDSANTLRNLGAAPAAAWLVAFGWQGLRQAASRRLGGARGRWVGVALTLVLVWGAAWQVHKLWVRHPAVPGIERNFNMLHVQLVALCARASDGAPVFVPTDFYDHKTFEFLTIGRDDIRPLDVVALLTRSEPPRDHRLLCTMLSANARKILERFPHAHYEGPTLSMGSRPFAALLRIPADVLTTPEAAGQAAEEMELDTTK